MPYNTQDQKSVDVLCKAFQLDNMPMALFFLILILIFGKFLANFERIVLGCIEAKVCK